MSDLDFFHEGIYVPTYRNDYEAIQMWSEQFLTTTEAAVLAGVEVRDINRLIDEKILPEGMFRHEDGRRVLAGACALVRFYFNAANDLTADKREAAIASVWRTGGQNAWLIARWYDEKPRWRYSDGGYLTLNFDRFVDETLKAHAQLLEARAMVVEDPGILSGTPVIRGTRIPIYDVAGLITKGVPPGELLEDYPGLSQKKVELAALYAKAVPQRGRPKTANRPRGTLVSSRTYRTGR